MPSQLPPFTTPDQGQNGDPLVLLISSNGTGMGHLTRLLAYAEHRPEGVSVRFLSLSQAVPVVAQFGHRYEYLPSIIETGLFPLRWNSYFVSRVNEVIERVAPAVVVFDGSYPYEGIESVRAAHPDVPWVWSRRGLWYRGYNKEQLAKSSWFERVIEPGDFAAPSDAGPTVQAQAERVRPVTLLDLQDLDDAQTARRDLGLAEDRPAALVTLGAGTINDPESHIRVVLEVLRSLGAQICVTQPAIAERVTRVVRDDADVRVVSEYPLSRRFRAFDLAVSAAGYNSVHELLRFGVPTLFFPNLETSLDDQRTRAHYVSDQGWAHCLDSADPSQVRKLLDDLLVRGREMVRGVAGADPGNGASDAMKYILAVAR